MNYYCQFWQYYLFNTFIVIFKWIIIAGNGNNYACAVFLSLFGMDDLSGFTDMDMEFRQFPRGCTIFLVPMNVLTNTSLESQDPWQSSYGARKNEPLTRNSRTNLSENLDFPLIFGRFELAPSINKRLYTSLHLTDYDKTIYQNDPRETGFLNM